MQQAEVFTMRLRFLKDDDSAGPQDPVLSEPLLGVEHTMTFFIISPTGQVRGGHSTPQRSLRGVW
jgi:hypothetical protein